MVLVPKLIVASLPIVKTAKFAKETAVQDVL